MSAMNSLCRQSANVLRIAWLGKKQYRAGYIVDQWYNEVSCVYKACEFEMNLRYEGK